MLMNARKKRISVRSFQSVKTRLVDMIARVKMDLKRPREEHVQVIHYTSFYLLETKLYKAFRHNISCSGGGRLDVVI